MKIAVLPGDGIGKEVTAQAVRVLEATLGNSVSYELKEAPIGGAGQKAVGDALPPETLNWPGLQTPFFSEAQASSKTRRGPRARGREMGSCACGRR